MNFKQGLVLLFSAGIVGGVLAEAVKEQPKDQGAGQTATSGKVTIVNGTSIPQSRIELVTKAQIAQGQANTPELQATVRERLIDLEVISQEAKKLGLDKNPETQAQLDMAREQILARAYQQNFMKANPIKDDTLKAEYDRVKGQMGDKEYKAKHILVAKEDDAKDIIAQLNKGGDFEKLAKEKSTDSGSKESGGKLDWNNTQGFVKPFSDALVKLQKGQYTDAPVKTPFGYHVIMLDDIRPLKAPAFDEVKENLRQGQHQQQFAKVVQDLRAKAKVEEK
jgi:peptidyl-prolyl cis-trans isomerase C